MPKSHQDLRFSLQLARNGAVLVLERFQPHRYVTVETLELEVGLSASLDTQRGFSAIKHQRGRLRRLVAKADLLSSLKELVSGGVALPPGLQVQEVELGPYREDFRQQTGEQEFAGQDQSSDASTGRVLCGVLAGTVMSTVGRVPFTLPWTLREGGGRAIVRASDPLLFGLASMPTWAVGRTVLKSLVSSVSEIAPPASVHFEEDDSAISVDPVAWIVWESLVTRGWRLPRLAGLEISFAWREGNLLIEAVPRVDRGAVPEPPIRVRQRDRFLGPQRVFVLGEHLLDEGKYEEAARYYADALDRHIDEPYLWGRAVELAVRTADPSAQKLVNRALERWPRAPWALLARAWLLEKTGHLEAAGSLYRELALHARQQGRLLDAGAAVLAASRVFGEKDPDQAVDILEWAMSQGVAASGLREQLAALYERLGRWEDLTLLIRAGLTEAAATSRVRGHVALGRIHLDHFEDPLRARSEFERALRIDRRSIEAWTGLVEAFLASGNVQKASTALDRMLAVRDDDSNGSVPDQVALLRARVLSVAGRGEEALQLLESRLDESGPDWVRQTADLARQQERWDLEVRALQRLCLGEEEAIGEGYRLTCLKRLTSLALEHGDVAVAQTAVDEALAAAPENLGVLDLAVRLSQERGRIPELVELLGRVARLDPDRAAAIHVRRARIMAEKLGRLDDAVEILQGVLGGDNPEVRLDDELRALLLDTLADVLRAAGRVDELISVYADRVVLLEAGAQRPQTAARIYREYADLLLARGPETSAMARRYLVRAVALAPEDVETLEKLARLLDDRGALAELEPLLTKLVDLARTNARFETLGWALWAWARLMARTDRYDQAASMIEESIRLLPFDQPLGRFAAQVFRRAGRLDRARQVLDELWALPGCEERGKVALELAGTLWSLDEKERAVTFYRAAIGEGLTGRERTECRRRLCDYCLEVEDWQGAVTAYLDLAEDGDCHLTGEEQAEAFFLAAQVSDRALGDRKQVLDFCRRALDRDPHHKGAQNMLEKIFFAAGQWEEVITILERKVVSAEGRPREQAGLLGRLARVELEKLGRIEAARRDYERALEADQDFLPALEFLGADAKRVGDLATSLHMYRRIVELSDAGAADQDVGRAARKTLAELLVLEGDLDEAGRVYRSALEFDPADQTLLEGLAGVLREQDRPRELVSVLRKLAEISRGRQGRDWRLELAGLLVDPLGEPALAAEEYRTLLRQDPDDRQALFGLEAVLARQDRQVERVKVLGRLARLLSEQEGTGEDLVSVLRKLAETALSEARLEDAQGALDALVDHGVRQDWVGEHLLALADVSQDESVRARAYEMLMESSEGAQRRRWALIRARHLFGVMEDPSATLTMLDAEALEGWDFDFLRAECLWAQQRWSQAFEVYESLLGTDPGPRGERAVGEEPDRSLILRRLFEIALERLDDLEAAQRYGKALLDIQPEDWDILTKMTDLARRRGDWLQVRRLLERRLRIVREAGDRDAELDVSLDLASLWKFAGADGLERAERLCRRAIEIDPKSIEALRVLSEIQAAQGAFGLARQSIEALLAAGSSMLSPQELGGYRLEAARLAAQTDSGLDAAMEHFRIAARILEGTSRISAGDEWLSLALARERWSEAAEAAEMLRDLRSHREDLDRLALAYEKLGRLDEAVLLLGDLSEKYPQDTDLRIRMRDLLEQSGRHLDLAASLEAEARREGDIELFGNAAIYYLGAPEGRSKGIACALEVWRGGRLGGADLLDRLFQQEDVGLDEQVSELLGSGQAPPELGFEAGRRRIARLGGMDSTALAWMEWSLSKGVEDLWPTVRRGLIDAGWYEELRRLLGDRIAQSSGSQRAELVVEAVRIDRDKLSAWDRAADLLATEIDAGGLEATDELMDMLVDALEKSGKTAQAEARAGSWAPHSESPSRWFLAAAKMAEVRGDRWAQVRWLQSALDVEPGSDKILGRLLEIGQGLEGFTLPASLIEKTVEQDRGLEVTLFLDALNFVASPEERYDLFRSLRNHVERVDAAFLGAMSAVAMDAGRVEEALDLMAEQYRATSPKRPDERAALSVAMAEILYEQGGDAVAAADLYRRAADEAMDFDLRRDALGAVVSMARKAEDPAGEEEALRVLREMGASKDEDLVRILELAAAREAWGETLELCDEISHKGLMGPRQIPLRAMALEGLGRWKDAAEAWLDAARLDAGNGAEHMLRAALLLRDMCRDAAGAVSVMRDLLAQWPERSEVADMAEALCTKNGLWKELVDVERVILEQTTDPSQRARLLHSIAVVMDRKLGMPDEAAALLAQAAAADENFYPVYRPLGEYHYRRREWAPAEEYLRKAMENPQIASEQKAAISAMLGDVLLDRERFDEALDVLMEAVSLDIHNKDLLKSAMEAARRADRPDCVVTLLLDAARQAHGPAKADYLARAGSICESQLHDQERAMELYEQAVEIAPERSATRSRLLDLLRDRGDWESVMRRLEAELHLVEQDRAKAAVAVELAALCEDFADDPDRAEHYLKMARKLDPLDGRWLRKLTDFFARRKQWADLVSLIEDVLDTPGMETDQMGGFLALLGRTYLEKLNEPDKAQAVFQRARTLGLLTERGAELLAGIYRDQGHYEDLVRLLRDRIESETDPEETRKLRRRLAEVFDKNLGHRKEAAEELVHCFLDHEDFEAGLEARRLFRDVGADAQALAVARLLVNRCPSEDRALHQAVLGELLAQQAGATEEAVAVLREALDERWDLPGAHRVLGMILLDQGDREEALVHLNAYLEAGDERGDDDASVHALVAEASLEQGDRDKALFHFEKALAQDPTRVDILEALAKLYRVVGRWEALDGIFRRWIVLEPDPGRRARLWFERARVQQDRLGDKAEAIRCLKEAVALRPRFLEASRELRVLLEEQGQFVEAVRLLRKELDAVGEADSRVRLLLHLGHLLERHLHRPHEAVEAYRRAVATSSRDQEALSNLVRMCSLMGRWLEAASVQEQLADVVGDFAALVRAARLFMRAGNPDGAVRCWLRLIIEGPGERLDEFVAGLEASVDDGPTIEKTISSVLSALSGMEKSERRLALLRLAVRMLVTLGDMEQAEPLVAELVAEDPDDPGAFAYRIRLLEEREDYQSVAKLLRERIAAQRDKDLVRWLWKLGQMERGVLNRPDLAIDTFRHLVEAAPDDVAAAGVLAELASRLGDYQTVYDQYRRLDARSVSLDDFGLIALAEAAEALGRDQEALEYYERLLRNDSDRRDVLEALARLSLLSGRLGQAIDVLERLLDVVPLTDIEARLETGRLLVEMSLAQGLQDKAAEHIEMLKGLVSDDPGVWRLAAETYEALGDWNRYMDALDRVAAMEQDRRTKARIFYRKAQVARERLGLTKDAADNLLKAADLDATFPPLWIDLSQYYMREGDWESVLEVCDQLSRFDRAEMDVSVSLATIFRRAIALLLIGGKDAAQVPGLLRSVDRETVNVGILAEILSEAADGLRSRGMSSAPLGRVLDAFGSGLGTDMVEHLARWIDRRLTESPDLLGARRVLLRVVPRVGQRTMLYEHQQMIAFFDPGDPVVQDQYDKLIGGETPTSALDVMGPLVSEDLRLPLRTILVRLSDLLSGFMRSEPERLAGEQPLEDVVPPILAAKIAGLVRKLRVRALDIRVFQDDEPTVRLVDWRPQAVLLSDSLLTLDESELFFILGRSLEWARSGVAFLENRSDEERDEILVALGKALGMESPEGMRVRPELVEILIRWGINSEALDRRDQDAVVTSLAAHWRSPCDYSTYVASQWRMCQRVGLMVSGDLSASLRAAALVEAGADILEPEAVEQRCRLVRESDALRELLRFGVSRLREKLHRVTQVGF